MSAIELFSQSDQIRFVEPNLSLNSGAYRDKDIMEPLLDSYQTPKAFKVEEFGAWYNFTRYFGLAISKERRMFRLDGSSTAPKSFCSNKLNNQKYNIITFVPLVLYNEFKFFFNLFFLLIALS